MADMYKDLRSGMMRSLKRPVTFLDVPPRAPCLLHNAGINRILDLAQVTGDDLLALPGMGRRTVLGIQDALREAGIYEIAERLRMSPRCRKRDATLQNWARS